MVVRAISHAKNLSNNFRAKIAAVPLHERLIDKFINYTFSRDNIQGSDNLELTRTLQKMKNPGDTCQANTEQ